MSVTVYSGQVVGLDARPISVEVDISPGLHLFVIVGLADKEVQESRERIAAAIKNLGALAPHKKSQRVIVNLAPADIKKEGPAFDLPIAMGYLLASGQINFNPHKKLFLGELGLDGGIRKVTGCLNIALAGRSAGFEELIVPTGNGSEAAMVEGIKVYEVPHLADVIEHLSGRKIIAPHPAVSLSNGEITNLADFKDIRGQEQAKRALEIAAAGGHNVLMEGPPGAGKTILATAFPSILPPLDEREVLEVAKIYSVAGLLEKHAPTLNTRPFRNPHHTSSHTAVIGGGAYPRPGEITLAHRGVLFLDEFPEFDRRVIESLRQPLETRTITVARSAGVETFPAEFILIGAMNPCPCGNFGNHIKDCSCAPGAIIKYRKKISGPMRDRMDIYIETPPVPYDRLEGEEAEASSAIRERVTQARARQKERFRGTAVVVNAGMSLPEIKKHIRLKENLKPLLRSIHERHQLSARSYHRLLKVSRTIADLAGSDSIEEHHIAEALQYKPRQEM